MKNQPNLKDEDFDWCEYLEAHLTFPFFATLALASKSKSRGERVKVQEVYDEDEHYGVIMKCKISRKTLYMTLIELQLDEKESEENKVIVDFYKSNWTPI